MLGILKKVQTVTDFELDEPSTAILKNAYNHSLVLINGVIGAFDLHCPTVLERGYASFIFQTVTRFLRLAFLRYYGFICHLTFMLFLACTLNNTSH